MLNCVDVSNYTGPLPADALNRWARLGVRLVIVQAVDPPPDYPPCVDQQQAEAVLATPGLALGAYVEHFTGTDIAARNADRFAGYGYPIERWWGAFEDTTQALQSHRESDCVVLLAYLDTLGAKRPAGSYTGPWFADYLPPGSQVLAGRAQWVADYNGLDVPGAPSVDGGNVTIHQYIGTTSLSGISGVDIDCAIGAEFATDPNPTPNYRVALASVTSPTGEIVPGLDAAMKLTSAKAMRAAVLPRRNRLVTVYNEFQP